MTENNLPQHIAIMPDGNRRWAKEKGLPTFQGHLKGNENFKSIVDTIDELKINILSIWAFSTENWNRTQEEIKYLMKLFETSIDENLTMALKKQRRLIHIGRKDRLGKTLYKKIEKAEDETKHFSKGFLVIGIDYGGKDEVVRAVNKIIKINQNAEISEKELEKNLDTGILPYPNPDLIIRTGGAQRTSGFMIWQSAYAEYIFHPKYFPDFSPEDLKECIEEYQRRQRRFGV